MKAIDIRHSEVGSVTSRVDGGSSERRKESQRVRSKRYRERHPERIRDSVRRWQSKNPEKKKEYDRRHYRKYRQEHLEYERVRRTDRELMLRYFLMKNYRLPISEYKSMLEEQGGLCAICGNPCRYGRLHVDHCHKTKKLRGLLCRPCNHGLGNFKDNPEYLISAIRYLEKCHV